MMTNLGIIGGLIGMLFFGAEGFLTVQLFTIFEVFTYYLIVFPMTQQIGEGRGTGFHFNPKLLIRKPMSLIPLTAIIIGLILRGFKVPAPEVLDNISSVIVPSVTGLIGFSIGMTLKVSRIRYYRKEAGLIALVPPQLYGLDLDLANSGWLVTTVIHLLIAPILILVLI